MIRLDGVTKLYRGGREALRDVSLEIGPGELVFLTGHSGAGKSTILKLIALVERPTRGQVLVDGRNIGRLPSGEIPAYRRQIGMVFQDHKLLEDRSTFDNVALPLVIAGLGRRETERRVRAALDQVGLLDKERQRPRDLSAGEQQRVGIARAVVTRPRLLIALGKSAASLLLGTDASIASLRGRVHRYQGRPLIVTYHPAYLLRTLPDKAKAWEDLVLARRTLAALEAPQGGEVLDLRPG